MRKKSEKAQVATLIRKELKTAFPGIKFSVRSASDGYSSKVDIDWIDGPTAEKVNEIVSKYKQGHFDGMTDCYEFSNSRDDIPQVSYVFTNRELSDELRAELVLKIEKKFGIDFSNSQEVYDTFNMWDNQVIWRASTGKLEL